MKKKLSIVIVFVLAFTMVACTKKKVNEVKESEPNENILMENVQNSINKNAVKVPDEISKIATVDGDLDKGVVIINTQGGPMYELDTIIVRMILDEVVGKTDTIVVNVHQQQTLNPNKFKNKEITFEEAKKYDTKSVDDLAKVVKYFKDEGKTVYVFGMSFGAWMIQDLIANYGVDIADKFFITNGRIDMPKDMWISFSKGGSGYFKNGTEAVIKTKGTMKDPENTSDTILAADKNISKLAAGLGHKRYSELLAKFDLSKVFYLYGQEDEVVGKLTDEEVNFLKKHGATVATYDGGHSAPNNKMKEGFNFLGIKAN